MEVNVYGTKFDIDPEEGTFVGESGLGKATIGSDVVGMLITAISDLATRVETLSEVVASLEVLIREKA